MPNCGVKAADFAVLHNTTMPVVLLECGFMTNSAEVALLMTAAYRAECFASCTVWPLCERLHRRRSATR
ncbi:N-acetylmuramoyl-L-alanine amidase [Paenibacillus sp. LHD-117]|uniref:N-acetylmuramoyl-L-alanine amidase family protein n=1 Tax=Paenibacillus sp. LHD-117 TaxID=3071412 RepID=UPI0027DFAA66|nr:N-acetylmuramoyl-L-alanine amidase [Paenibacillus sp. LHD-117]MDQ6419930.1 N-acetylmuramoyl-L-alanine amidase [Paenibacillus sp. LHD-117]